MRGYLSSGIFFVALSGPPVPRLRASLGAAALLERVNVASLALMTVFTAQLSRATLVDVPTAVFAGASAVLLVS